MRHTIPSLPAKVRDEVCLKLHATFPHTHITLDRPSSMQQGTSIGNIRLSSPKIDVDSEVELTAYLAFCSWMLDLRHFVMGNLARRVSN